MQEKDNTPVQEKQAPKAPKWLLWIALVLAVLLTIGVLIANMLINGLDSTEDTETEERIEEQQTEEEALMENGEFNPYITWESMNIPNIFPEYTDGDIGTPDPPFKWLEEGIPNFVTIFNSSEKFVREYVLEAMEQGWEEEAETETDESIIWRFSKEENEKLYTMELVWHTEELSYLSMILTSAVLE